MRFVISTTFHNEFYKVDQSIEIKSNELQTAFDVCKAFVVGSKSCEFSVFDYKNRTKLPDFKAFLTIRDAVSEDGILKNEINFSRWILKFKERSFTNV